jgi:hypothetical protein
MLISTQLAQPYLVVEHWSVVQSLPTSAAVRSPESAVVVSPGPFENAIVDKINIQGSRNRADNNAFAGHLNVRSPEAEVAKCRIAVGLSTAPPRRFVVKDLITLRQWMNWWWRYFPGQLDRLNRILILIST